MSKGIVILGSHRSGSSCATVVCERNGYYGGEDLIDSSKYQKDGCGESWSVVQLNDDILKRGRGNLYTPPVKEYITPEEEKNNIARILKKVKEYNRQGRWVLKDPRIAYLLRYWRSAIEQTNSKVNYIITYRHPYNTTASLIARHKGSEWDKELRWTELKENHRYNYYLNSWVNAYKNILNEYEMLLKSGCVYFIDFDDSKNYRKNLHNILKSIEPYNWDMRSVDDKYRHQMFTDRHITEDKVKDIYHKLNELNKNQ